MKVMAHLRLLLQDLATGERQEPLLTLPIALGRDQNQIPTQLNGLQVSRIILNHDQVSRYHALINLEEGSLILIDQKSTNGTQVNGQEQQRCMLHKGDLVQIGPYQIRIDSIALPQAGPTKGLKCSNCGEVYAYSYHHLREGCRLCGHSLAGAYSVTLEN